MKKNEYDGYFNEMIRKAYKKLKCSVYFDKTLLPLRNKIIEFETGDIDEKLGELLNTYLSEDRYRVMEQEILDSIDFYAFPKSVKQPKEKDKNEASLIVNTTPDYVEIDKIQYFINMDVRGHILGVLWLLLAGWKLDKNVYEHSYGNRIRKHISEELEKKEELSYSPYLFEPYFQQYESWRDSALKLAQNSLNKNQDIVILTMDFEKFYYSVDINENCFKKLKNVVDLDEECEKVYRNEHDVKQVIFKEAVYRLNDFIFKVIDRYAKKFEGKFDRRNILPIGFLPSNVLGNWALYNMDKAVVDGWNPLYYGRYVDDIIIVDKVEKNSDIYKKARADELKSKDVLDFYLTQCSRWRGMGQLESACQNYALFVCENNTYTLQTYYNPDQSPESKIKLQNSKIKVFYFKHGESDALLQCFRNQITHNKSEFRFLPEDNAVFQEDDYSEIYDIDNKESINKFRGIDGISIDKFALSKFLGKYSRISGLVNDRVESRFAKDITKIFDNRTILDNYIVWERVLGILVVNNQWGALEQFTKKIFDVINNLQVNNNEIADKRVKNSLYDYFYSAWTRVLALSWSSAVKEHIDKVCVRKRADVKYNYETVCESRKNTLHTKMYDKYAVPVFLDVLGEKWIDELDDEKSKNLCDIKCIMAYLAEPERSGKENTYEEDKVFYYPYMVTMYDLYMVEMLKKISEQGQNCGITDNQGQIQIELEQTEKSYIQINYRIKQTQDDTFIKTVKSMEKSGMSRARMIAVGKSKKKKLNIAIANAKLDHKDFEKLVKGSPNRLYERYASLSRLVNQAIDEKADLLVLPESYIPLEWLTTVARTCARNHMGLISGVEHVIIGENVFNLTAVILPYDDKGYPSATLTMHLKNHYAPSEIDEIEGYRLHPVEGNGYELFCWNDCWFPVYCCFELASIQDRSLFQSYADLLVAVEWNKDVNYYSNILESLSRDLHCYCVQVNSSDYGDSRITLPAKTAMKDIIKTKGGSNDTILVGTIDIEKLRDFQFKEFTLQKTNSSFKPTPPMFDKEIVKKKIQGRLAEYIIRTENI